MTHLPVKVKNPRSYGKKNVRILIFEKVVRLGALRLDTQYSFTAQWYSTVSMAIIF